MKQIISVAIIGGVATGFIIGRLTTPWRRLHDKLMIRALAIGEANERHIAELSELRKSA